MSSLNNRIDDLLEYSKDKLREIKGDIKMMKKVPGKYAYVFEKMVALQEYTISGVEGALTKKSRKGGVRTRRRNTVRAIKRRN